MANLINARNLFKTYGEAPNETHALNNVSVNINKGEFVAIIGPSGSGKSTLMHILGCLEKPTGGEYTLDGRDVSELSEVALAKIRNQFLGFVFQSFNLLSRTTSLKNVILPLVYSEIHGKEREIRATKLLNDVGIGEKINSFPNQLSGGQQQRVAIARSLVNEPLVIFADEPTGNLDTKASQEIIDIFKQLNRDGKTIVMITHEMDVAKQAKRIITVRDGKIVSDRKIKK